MYLILLWSAVILAALYFYFRKRNCLFSRYEVKTLPTLPLLGNMGTVITGTEHVVDLLNRLYFKFPEERFVGRYEFMKPVVEIRDPELVKNIIIKDFEYFIDHRHFVDDQNEPFFGRNLLCLKGQEWRDMRATLSPAFTTSKIRKMVPFMVEVTKQTTSYVKNNINESEEGYLNFDVKDLTARITTDIIATCVFGLKVDSQKEQNNMFYKMGKDTVSFQFRRLLVILGYTSFPNIIKILKVKAFSDTIKNFFKNLVMSTMQNREENNIIRPDMIHLLMEAKKAWSDDDLVAQAFLFFIAGFESISTTLCFFLHEVARNPDVQERLVKEIKKTHAKNNGKFDFSSIQDLTYMDMVLSETLRKWPSVAALDRACVKDYNCGKPNDKAKQDFIIRKGTMLSIPVCAIHNDPKYFPNPNKFDPERFSDENQHKIEPFTYMPFGMGPRHCIGTRFGLIEIKTVLYHLLQELELSPCEKTNTSGRLAPSMFSMKLDGGFWLRFKVRA